MNGEVAHAFAATFVDELAASGLQAVCISPGSRSAPLAMAFARHSSIKVFVHIDERSGAYFALGLAKGTARPVALVCTSGTAAVEYHPAVVEAFHSRTPLLVLTADRPPELRDRGADQTIDQLKLYGSATRWFFDVGTPEEVPAADRAWRRLAARALAEASGPPAGPVHLNLAFREPLVPPPGEPPRPHPPALPSVRIRPGTALPDDRTVEELAAALEGADRPMLIAGAMPDGARLLPAVDALARRAALPVLAEPTSQLRMHGTAGLVETYDALLRDREWSAGHRPDLVIRLGATPISKPLNQWLASQPPACTVLLDPEITWSDPDNLVTDILRCDPLPLLEGLAARVARPSTGWQDEWVRAGQAAAAALGRALKGAPLYEAHAVRALAQLLPEAAAVVLGPSMAIRDVDSFWPATDGQRFLCNRGVNGIDGVVSTGLGVAAAGGPTVILCGDLTLFHDMNGLWAIRRYRLKATVIVLDNDGGGIFSFLPQADHPDVFEEIFGTPLGLRFEDVAALYDLDFSSVDRADELDGVLRTALHSSRSTMVAIRFSRRDSLAGHRAAWAAVAGALTGERR